MFLLRRGRRRRRKKRRKKRRRKRKRRKFWPFKKKKKSLIWLSLEKLEQTSDIIFCSLYGSQPWIIYELRLEGV